MPRWNNKNCGFKVGHKSYVTKESIAKMSKSKKGVKLSKEHKVKIGLSNKGRRHTKESKNKLRLANLGKIVPIEQRMKISKSLRGNKSSLWKGGITDENLKIRSGIEFRLWRESVFARDNWTCQKTKIKGSRLHPHHIQNFSKFPELRFAIDNGITLSKESHREFHKKYGVKNNTREQLIKFLGD